MDFEERLARLNTCYPGEIVSFNAETQFAVVRVALEQYFKGLDRAEEEYTKFNRPLLHDVPVQFPRGGGFSITMPVQAGDSCLVLFSQRGMDHWLYENKMEAGKLLGKPSPQHLRMHNYSDALCIVGFSPEPKAVPEFNPLHLVMRNLSNDNRITIKDNEVIVDSTIKVEVNAPTVDINATTVNLNAATVNVSGNLTVGGTVDSDGSITGAGISLDQHTHNETGGVTQGPN